MRRLVPYLLVLAFLAAITAPRWADPIPWTPDGLYYEAQSRELRGEEAEAARRAVFASDLAALPRQRDAERALADRRVTDPTWVEYSSQFYRRRWTIPLAAAALDPVAGSRSVQVVSLLGYGAFAVALLALLRRFFAPLTAWFATVVVLAAPQFFETALSPLTDTWGLALLATGLLLALHVIDGRRVLLLPLAGVLATLSLTRDNGWVLVAALLAYAAFRRSRSALLAAGIGVASILPAHLVFPIDSTALAAFTVNGSRIPPSTSLDFIAEHYGEAFRGMLGSQWGLQSTGLPSITGLVLLVGLAALALPGRGRETLVGLARAAVLGGALFVLTLPQPGYRILFVLLPSAAVGYGLLLTALGGALKERRRRWSQPEAPA